jgi:type II secretory pathway component GspD/PulD (secretin)
MKRLLRTTGWLAGLAILCCGFAIPPASSGEGTKEAATGVTVSQTFKPVHLGLDEMVSVLKDMTGVQDVVADDEERTIVARGPESMIRRMDSILKTFDSEASTDSGPLQVRVFQVENISSTRPSRCSVQSSTSRSAFMQPTESGWRCETPQIGLTRWPSCLPRLT